MTRKGNRGFTLIELMVGLTLGMLLSLVMAQLFSNTSRANRATEDSARIQENARFATDVIGRTVRIAGYRNDPLATSDSVFDPATAPALSGTDGTGIASDTLIVRFQGGGAVTGTADNTILDCLGNPVAPDYGAVGPGLIKAYNKFSIAPGADGRNALFCSNNSAVNPGTELVPGVEAMQVIYGEDTTATPDGTADRFVPIGSVTTLGNVVVVRVYLLLSGKENVRVDPAASVTYPVGGVNYTFSDQKIRRVVTATVVLRNRAP